MKGNKRKDRLNKLKKKRNILKNNVSHKQVYRWLRTTPEEKPVTSEVGENVITQDQIDNDTCEECGYVGQHSNNCIKVE